MSEVVRLVETPGFDFDGMLESLKGRDLQSILVLTIENDGSFDLYGNVNIGEALLLIEHARHNVVFGGEG